MALFLVLTCSFNQAFSGSRKAKKGRRSQAQQQDAKKRKEEAATAKAAAEKRAKEEAAAAKAAAEKRAKEEAAEAEAKRLAPEHNQLVVYTHPKGQKDVARDSGSAAATEAAKDAYRARVRANHPDKVANTVAREQQAATKISSLWRGYATRKKLKAASPAAAAWSSGPAPAAIAPKRASSEAETIGKDYQRHLNTLSPERKAAVLKISRDAKNRDRKARVEKALAKKQAAQAAAQAAQAPAVADSKKWSTKKKVLVGTGAVLGAGALAGVGVGIGQLADKAETPDDPELVQQWQEQGEQEENKYGVATQTAED